MVEKRKDTLEIKKRKKNTGKKQRGFLYRFWYRFMNFTVEPRKIVIIEGDTIKLVPMPPETFGEDTEEDSVLISEETTVIEIDVKETPKILPEITAGSNTGEHVATISGTAVLEVDLEEEIPAPAETTAIDDEKPVVTLPEPEIAVAEDEREQQATDLAGTAVVDRETPTSVPSETIIKDDIKEPVTASSGTSVVEEAVEEIISPAEETAVIEEPAIEEKVIKPPPVVPDKLKKGLEKTRSRFWSRLKNVFSFRKKIDESVLEELEDILIGADIGVRPVQKLMQELHEAWKSKTLTETSEIYDFIKQRLKEDLQGWQIKISYAPTPPTVIMVVGVNGVGKTTSIAKLANLLIKDGKSVMVAASDTFRAAAVDQLDIWSKRIGAEIVKHQTGSDPAAVAFDALDASISRGIDVLIVDTAGRLHTHENLMKELGKIKRVLGKRTPGAPHEVLLVLDATTGQNAISQAKMFKQAVDVTGIFLTKIDGTAKGGVVLGMRSEINIPVKFIGLGEKADDIERFNADAFVNALFEQ